jgi:hypothetical protein
MNSQELYEQISVKFQDIRGIVLEGRREDNDTLIGWLEALHYVKNLMGDIEGICCDYCGNEYCSCYDINMNPESDDFGLRVL